MGRDSLLIVLVHSYLLLLSVTSSVSLEETAINVRSNGNDTRACLTGGSSSCRTLEYALSMLTSLKTNISITVHYSHYLNMSVSVSNVDSLSISGTDQTNVTIACSKLGDGILFMYSANIMLSGITWKNCSVRHGNPFSKLPSQPASGAGSSTLLVYSSIFMHNCTNVTISSCSFSSDKGSGLTLMDIQGYVTIEYTTFLNHHVADQYRCFDNTSLLQGQCSPQSMGLHIGALYHPSTDKNYSTYENVDFLIKNCSFIGNVNNKVLNDKKVLLPSYMQRVGRYDNFGIGGGLTVSFLPLYESNISLVILGSFFINNTALYGAGMAFYSNSWVAMDNIVTISHCVFDGNIATYNGGGLSINVYQTFQRYNSNSFNNTWKFFGTSFKNNLADWGGGLSLSTSFTSVAFLNISFEGCMWKQNLFTGGASAVGLFREIDIDGGRSPIKPNVTFTNCRFEQNLAKLSPYNRSYHHVSGIFYTEGIPVNFTGETIFLQNTASALCVSETNVSFSGKVHFVENCGFNGGGVYLYGIAWMTFHLGLVLNFTSNSAFESGGALYCQFPPPVSMKSHQRCFITYCSPGNDHQPPSEWHNVTVVFANNTARVSGNAVYINNPWGCDYPNDKLFPVYPDTCTNVFDFSGQNGVHIATDPETVFFSNAALEKDEDGFSCITVMPGENLDTTIHVKDKLGNKVNTFLSVKCSFVEKYKHQNFLDNLCDDNSNFPYMIIGETDLIPSFTPLSLKVAAPQESEDKFVLIFSTIGSSSVMIALRVNFRPCNLGFLYDESSKQCQCHDIDGGGNMFTCSYDYPCILREYWYGKIINDSNQTINVFHRCTPRSCSPVNLKNCGPSSAHYRLDISNICPNDLGGHLCSSCSHNSNLSLAYNGYGCFECGTLQKVLLAFLIVAECVFIVGIVVTCLKLNIKISTSGFYGLLYFYSVVPFFLPGNLPDVIEGIILIFVDIASLDFDLLMYTKFCLFEGASAIHYTALHYIYPVAITFMIFLLIKIDQYCIRRVSFFTGEAAIQALCIMLLISYTSISTTSLTIVLPLTFMEAGSNDTNMLSQQYVYADPAVKYFDTSLHLPYWLVAMIMLSALVLPYAFLMIFAPFLMKCINLTKIKPILDEYQNCFKDQHRWFAGLYLIARPVLFLITALPASPGESALFQQLFCVSLLVLVATLQPYKHRIYNFIDLFLLCDLVAISFISSNPTSNEVFSSQGMATLRTVLISMLNLLPMVLLTGGFIILFVYQCCFKRSRTVTLRSVLPRSTTNTYFHEQSDSSAASEDDLLLSNELPSRFYEQEEIERKSRIFMSSQSYSSGRKSSGVGEFWRRLTTSKSQSPSAIEPSVNHVPVFRPSMNKFSTN